MNHLQYKQQNLWDTLTAKDKQAIEDYCKGYKTYLDQGKTERLAVRYSIQLAEQAGFVPYNPKIDIKPGAKVYVNNRDRALYLAVIGKQPLDQGMNIIAAHVDSPRLDLKPLPLFEDSEMAYFKTHYYGGVRKYQWVGTPLALHGVVITKDGALVEISVGDRPDEPCFTITDLLPHLSQEHNKKTLGEGHTGEGLNALIGGIPAGDKADKDRVRGHMLTLIHNKYGVTEEDFLSAELMLVPAGQARDVGLDRSFIGGYGQDDRVCAWASIQALLDLEETPEKTAVVVLADKEEVGSDGVSGMKSRAFELFAEDICDSQGVKLSHCFANSFCLSMDVCNGFDPNYPEVSEKRNNAKMNYGIGVLKYTGVRGKGGTSDASAEVVGRVRQAFDAAGVTWQMAELGKVDQGGGGTVAKDLANRNIDVIDAGVPVLSMHSPFEITAKADCYMAYRAARAVFENIQ
ncbi:MAG: aminopeptidase [Oscillospiraceae bacterium]|nr:aminopeptidase [Oscillospiraceae bacterium]